jgi:tetratricopeptide (TPR) repeat protein
LSVLTSLADRGDPYLYLGLVATIAGFAAIAWAIWRRRWIDVFCLFCAALCYGMVSNVFLIGTIFGERLMFIPSAFLLIFAAIHLARIGSRILTAGLTVVLIAFSLRTVTYAARWNNRLDFYLSSLADQPRSVRLHELAAFELMEDGNLSEAAKIADEGKRQTPDYWNIWYCSALINEKRGDNEAALADCQKAFDLQQNVLLDLELLHFKHLHYLATQAATQPATMPGAGITPAGITPNGTPLPHNPVNRRPITGF